ncbi:MAG: ABC transporter permease [Lentisphaeraceae bacterium]|nr:ABC transporter permease [Lentisphaeraceae bacterium]
MDETFAIASSLWKRLLGVRVVYFLTICAVSLIAITNMYDILMIGESRALMVDTGMMLTTIAAMLTVISLAFDIPKELQSGIASVLLAKPLGRTHYLMGKLVGVSWVGIFITSLISVGFVAIYSVSHGTPPAGLVKSLFLIVISVIPMASIVLFFSSFLNEAVAATISTVFIWVGYSLSGLGGFTLFDLSLFNMGAEAFYNYEIPPSYLLKGVVSALLTAISIVCVTSFIFNKRDLQ